MSLSKKYDIPPEKIKMLIKDGWISCSAPSYEEIYYEYKKGIASGKSKPKAIQDAADKCNISDRVVYRVIHRFD